MMIKTGKGLKMRLKLKLFCTYLGGNVIGGELNILTFYFAICDFSFVMIIFSVELRVNM